MVRWRCWKQPQRPYWRRTPNPCGFIYFLNNKIMITTNQTQQTMSNELSKFIDDEIYSIYGSEGLVNIVEKLTDLSANFNYYHSLFGDINDEIEKTNFKITNPDLEKHIGDLTQIVFTENYKRDLSYEIRIVNGLLMRIALYFKEKETVRKLSKLKN